MTSRHVLPGNTRDPQQFISDLFFWFEQEGQSYYDESVTQLAHGLQAAHLASEQKAGDSMIVAALFHDIGHLIIDEHSRNEDFLNHDAFHERAGCLWAERVFGETVSEPVRLHVPAKRWLCSTDDQYYNRLSGSSKRSLELQGGLMNSEEVMQFELGPFSRDAIQLRRWDDDAKVSGKAVPELESYRDVVLHCMTDGQA